MKKLLLRADDLGFSEAVNYGIDPQIRRWVEEQGFCLVTYDQLSRGE